jgi:hypothetical protein
MKIYVATVKNDPLDTADSYVLGVYPSEEKANENINKWINFRGDKLIDYAREERFYLYDEDEDMNFQIDVESADLDNEPCYD